MLHALYNQADFILCLFGALIKPMHLNDAWNLVFICSPLSESASTVGAGLASPAAQSGIMPMAEVFKLAASSFKVHDWNLFGGAWYLLHMTDGA